LAVHRAWLDHLVLLVRGQQLADEDFIAFSRRLGNLDWTPIQETPLRGRIPRDRQSGIVSGKKTPRLHLGADPGGIGIFAQQIS
jgi:Taurine catabolism dioxygenase TauD, TfdA family